MKEIVYKIADKLNRKDLVSLGAVPASANVIFNLDRVDALATVHGYRDDIGISYSGSDGEWGYLWKDESFMSGENATQKILDHL